MSPSEAIDLLRRIRDRDAPASAKPDSLAGLDFSGLDLSGLDLSGINLDGCMFAGANLSRAQLFNARLHGAVLRDADLTDANLHGAQMDRTGLDHVKAQRAGFGLAVLRNTTAFQADFTDATFSKSTLDQCDFRCATLRNARMREAGIVRSDLTEADLSEADMSLTSVDRSTFDNADLRGARLRRLAGYETASWIGTDVRDINFAGAYMMQRHVLDENYLKEFRTRGPRFLCLYLAWKATSNCGRSMSLWCVWIVGLILAFAWLFTRVDVDYGPHPTPLSPLYFSVVTFTTLGYGDVRPASTAAQILAMSEVICGYLMLGGLLAILSNKMARRAG